MKVGNLESRRDFLDVRDVARAYRMILESGQAGQAYNIASGNLTKIQVLLDELCRLADVQPRIEIDPVLFRPTDDGPVLDITKITDHTGWRPQIPLPQTLRDILGDIESAH
jgi:GDP-4-dehydro-6-deoxy-D-mannose reductase